MTEKSDEVFVIEGENLRPLPMHPFGNGQEADLQTLIEAHPEVLPGKQMDPNSEDPPRFVPLCPEMPVGSGSLDILLVDQRGVLTLVETKLAKNPESRREVIGQIVEYAANATELWKIEHVRKEAAEYWTKKGGNVDEVTRAKFNEDNVEDFWKKVDENLGRGQIRLIVAADELRPEARRIIEYLNEEMSNATIYGLELRYYEDESSRVIVPRLVGQTQAVADRKETAEPRILWTKELLRDAYNELSDFDLGKRLRRVLDWAVDRGFFMERTAKDPGFALRGRSGKRIASFYPVGAWCYLDEKNYPGGAQERDQLVAELKTLGMYQHDLDPWGVTSDRNLIRKLTDLSEDEFRTLLDIFSRFCAKAEGAA